MAIEVDFDENEYRLVVTVRCDDIYSDAEVLKTFDDLDKALDVIRARLTDGEIASFSIAIEREKSFLSRLLPLSKGRDALAYIRTAARQYAEMWRNEYNPWEAMCPEFWLSAASEAALRPRIVSWIARVEELVAAANRSGRATASLWESDEVQFGEPVVTLLALHDVEFVPCYTRLLCQWDMEHEVAQIHEIDRIVRKHGVCRETEDLLYHRASDGGGQWGIDQIENLFPFLKEKVPNFIESPLFERIVAGFYETDRDWRMEEFENYKARKARDSTARPPNLAERGNYFMYAKDDELRTGAEKVIARLDEKFPPPDFGAV